MAEGNPMPPHVDVAGYVLDGLHPEERRRFEEHLSSCVECGHELETRRRGAALIRIAAEPVDLPDSLEARVLAAIAAEPLRPASRPAPVIRLRSRRNWRPRWRGAWAFELVAALALAVGGAAGGAHLLTSRDQPAVQPSAEPAFATIPLVGAQPGSQARGTARLVSTGTLTTIELTVDGLKPPPAGQLYAVWLVGNEDTLQRQDRIAVGSFTVSGPATVTLRWQTAASLGRYPNFGVTREPTNGNPLRQGPQMLTPAPVTARADLGSPGDGRVPHGL